MCYWRRDHVTDCTGLNDSTVGFEIAVTDVIVATYSNPILWCIKGLC